MHNATDHGFNCPASGRLAPTTFWTVEIKLRGAWEPTDAFGCTRQDVADDARHWLAFYPPTCVRVVERNRA